MPEIPQGASNLMDLFAPPPPPPSGNNANSSAPAAQNKREGANAADSQESPTKGEAIPVPVPVTLQSMFQPPPEQLSRVTVAAPPSLRSLFAPPSDANDPPQPKQAHMPRESGDDFGIELERSLDMESPLLQTAQTLNAHFRQDGDEEVLAVAKGVKKVVQRRDVATLQRQTTIPRSNVSRDDERSSLLPQTQTTDERTYLQSSAGRGDVWSSSQATSNANGNHAPPSTVGNNFFSDYATPKSQLNKSAPRMDMPTGSLVNNSAVLPVIGEECKPSWTNRCEMFCRKIAKEHLQATTFIGSFMILLYHIVFCLAMGSSIIRPSTNGSILGLMTKMAASGVIFASPVYLLRLGSDISVSPATDLFLAPFLAKLAAIVDQVVARDVLPEDQEEVFMSSFAVLSGLGMVGSAGLIVLSSKFKMANLGAFLPFPVLCGFFTAIGIMTWSLAFNVDSGGKKIGTVLFSGDGALILRSFLHHMPSMCTAILMRWLGPKNSMNTTALIAATIVTFYGVMAVTGTSLAQAVEAGWFWPRSELTYQGRGVHVEFDKWAAPAPFGVWNSMLQGKVHWGAVWEGMSMACALSFLYMLRCSLHLAALKKSAAQHVRTTSDLANVPNPPLSESSMTPPHRRKFSEALDIEAVVATSSRMTSAANVVRAKQSTLSLPSMMNTYAISQLVSAAVGSFGVAPALGISKIMSSLGADRIAPQFGSIFLLSIFYLTNFELVAYIPKTAFSSLICLSFLDMVITWGYDSYFKTKEKMEWLVVPLIVVFAFVVGLLQAVFLGIALSTFIFVAAFFQTGVVKFMATGLTVRSTIERSAGSGNWLDDNGDKIQILVIQNYLFFGNASSLLAYISSMFDEPDDGDLISYSSLPPLPRYIILDMTLVSGMDTSTADVFLDIKTLCSQHNCKLFCAGISSRLRGVLALGNFKPESGDRSSREVRFFADLDAAIGKAEDCLLVDEFKDDFSTGSIDTMDPADAPGRLATILRSAENDWGFKSALQQIDDQHQTDYAIGLVQLYEYTNPLDLEPGQRLYHCHGGPIADCARGLFFIEQGLMKIERDSSIMSINRGSRNPLDLRTFSVGAQDDSLTRMKARELNPQSMKRASVELARSSSTIRLARIGPGWVLGAAEFVSGAPAQGRNVAVTSCRLHHLPFHRINEIEQKDGQLALRLYKLLSYLVARQQQVTIGQLATLQSIMTSASNHQKPIRRYPLRER